MKTPGRLIVYTIPLQKKQFEPDDQAEEDTYKQLLICCQG